MFGTTEQVELGAEVATKLRRLRDWLDRRGLPALVLTGSDTVAWLTAGLTNPIERGSPASPLWLVVTHETLAAVATNVERPRLEAEGGLGIPVHEVPWHEPEALPRAAAELAGTAPALDVDHAAELAALRLALLPAEQKRLAALGADAAKALEGALAQWRPGERDRAVQARVAAGLEEAGAFTPCLIVGGDERVERFRHPLAVGAPVRFLVMAVVVAERGGLHVAATRFACAGRLPDDVRRALDAARAVEAAVLEATRVGATYGDALRALAAGYAAVGHPGAWREHYQGGPVGYRQREFEIVPTDTGSRWFSTPIEPGHAVAWNPSVAGGGKAEDTYLVGEEGLHRLTAAAWPAGAVLDVESGGWA